MIFEAITCVSFAGNVAWATHYLYHKHQRDKVRAYARHKTMLPPAPCASGCKACALARQHPTMFKCDRAARHGGTFKAQVSWTKPAHVPRDYKVRLANTVLPPCGDTLPAWRDTWRDAFAAYEAERPDKTPTDPT